MTFTDSRRLQMSLEKRMVREAKGYQRNGKWHRANDKLLLALLRQLDPEKWEPRKLNLSKGNLRERLQRRYRRIQAEARDTKSLMDAIDLERNTIDQ